MWRRTEGLGGPPGLSRALLLLTALVLLSALSLAVALGVGSTLVGWEAVRVLFSAQTDALAQAVVLELRWPRALAAFATGGLLALAGTLMQVLLRNPLADPYILGVSGGAAVAALLAMLAGIGGLALTGSAFVGALIATLLVFGLARGHQAWSPTRLLLTGVVLAAGWGALISFILALSPQQQLRSMLFWLMGDLGYVQAPNSSLALLGAGLIAALVMARSLNLLGHGELQASALGVAVGRTRVGIYLLATLLTAVAVTQAGSIGFVGLIVPHMARLMGARDHRVLLPAAVLLGGSLLVLADTLARSMLAPQQLPVGVVTALLGVPVFLLLLNRSRP